MPTMIEELLIGLGYKVDDKPLTDAQKKAREAGETIRKEWAGIGAAVGKTMLGIGAAAAAAAGGIFKLVDSSTQAADDIAKGARNAGFSAREYQRMQHAAGLAGVEMGVLSKSTQNLNRDIARGADAPKEFRDALADVGLTFEDLRGSAEENLGTILDALRGVEDEGKRSGLALLLLGRAGRQMGTLIEGGSEGLRTAGDEAERLGAVLDQKALKASEEFQDAMTRMKATIGAVARDIGISLAPMVQEIADGVREWVVENRAVIQTKIEDFVRRVTEAVRELLPVVVDIVMQLGSFAEKAIQIVDALGGAKGAIALVVGFRGAIAAIGASARLAAAGLSTMSLAAGGVGVALAGAALIIAHTERKIANLRAGLQELQGDVARAQAENRRELQESSLQQLQARKEETIANLRAEGFSEQQIATMPAVAEVEAEIGRKEQQLGERVRADIAAGVSAAQRHREANAGRRGRGGGRKAAKPKEEKEPELDPMLSEILQDENVPDVKMSSLARGAQVQTLVSTINNHFNFDIDQAINGAGSPVETGDMVLQRIRDFFTQQVEGATKTVKVNFAR